MENKTLIAVISDLHLDDILPSVAKNRIKIINDIEADYLIIAGDVCSNTISQVVYGRLKPKVRKIIMVRGNHEYYSNHLEIEPDYPEHVHYLTIDNPFETDTIKFSGDTLWTAIPEHHKNYITQSLNDYKYIYRDSSMKSLIDTDYITNLHNVHIIGIKKSLSTTKKNIVITHHSPSFDGVVLKYLGNKVNSAFHSNAIDEFKDENIPLWIHGHCHDDIEYMINDTKVLCNPYGYYGEKESSVKYLYI